MIAPSVLRTLEARALEGWKGAVHPLTLTSEDLVRWFSFCPIHRELRVVLNIGRRAREHLRPPTLLRRAPSSSVQSSVVQSLHIAKGPPVATMVRSMAETCASVSSARSGSGMELP
jgi:hypothetical protein